MLFFLLSVGLSWAEQVSHRVTKGKQTWQFEVSWLQDLESQDITYALSSAAVETDLQIPTRYTAGQLAKEVAAEVNAWARTVNSDQASITARGSGNGRLRLKAKGLDEALVGHLLQRARQEEQRAEHAILSTKGYRKYSSGIAPDYSALVELYASELASLHAALAQPNLRAHTARALGFVQSIPYESRRSISFRRPLALLAANAGDCDSKAVLFLALMRRASPNLPLTIVDIPEHVFVGVGISPQPGEQAIEVEGTTYVLMEPVGPGMTPIGELSPRSLQALQGGQAKVIEVN